MKSFLRYLAEAEGIRLKLDRISPADVSAAKAAQEACKIIADFAAIKDVSLQDVERFHAAISKFSTLGGLKEIIARTATYLEDHKKSEVAKKSVDDDHHAYRKHADDVKAAFLQSKFSKQHKVDTTNKHATIDVYSDATESVKNLVKNRLFNKSSFFGTTRLLADIDEGDYKKISEIDFSKKLYSYGKFPKNEEFDYAIAYLLNLSDKPEITVSSHEFRLLSRLRHDDDENYKLLKTSVDRYLHNNDKKLIPEILHLIEAVPEIKKANDKSKSEIKIVYRGIPNGENVVDQDREAKFVATSTSKHSAKNFALQKGHLDSERRSEYGQIIVYEVGPESILFDTEAISTLFNEAEVLIDATKATVQDIIEV